jgi:salicylate hydroxylase
MPATATDRTIVIAGAGIGGLSAAISLARAGWRCHVVERSSKFSTDGAGIQLGPNATRILENWGVLDDLLETAVRPDAVRLYDGRTGREVANVPLGRTAAERYGAPYIVIHRSDLHATLLRAARGFQSITLTQRFKAGDVAQDADRVVIAGANGAEVEGTALIGADGVWSHVRGVVAPQAHLRYAGRTAWRTLVDISSVPRRFAGQFVGLWMSPDAHIVHYPVRGGATLNLVAVVRDASAESGWSKAGDKEQIKAYLQAWPDDIRSLVARADRWRTWSLADIPRLSSWTKGRIALLGDAAHPVLPFLAQGGVMAIEDAQALTSCLADDTISPADGLRAYQSRRIGRAARVSKASRKMDSVYHMRGPAALARNTVLRLRQPGALLASYDWLYGFRADA